MQRTDTAAASSAPSTERARVKCRLVTEWADLQVAASVINSIWEDPALASPSLLRAYTHFGNPAIGAFDGTTMCGVSVGFLAPAGGVHLHSHITGVVPEYQHAGVGFALKSAQRDWCVANGIDEVTWTFDPMIARNAYFNHHKLGATAKTLLPGFYGEMHDAFNHGEITDRVEAHWQVSSPRVVDALGGRGPNHVPVMRRVAVPSDYLALRAEDPEKARQARLEVRTQLLDAFADGLEIVDFTRAGEYCFAQAG